MDHRFRTFFILAALWLMVFSSSSQVLIIAPILPRIGDALQIPETLRGTLVTAYAIMLSTCALITGPISDKLGRRYILIAGSATMAIVLLLHSLAMSYGSLLVMRALAGMAGGMLSGAAVAYVGDYFPYQRRGWANGWVMSGMAFGQIVGIPAGTLLAGWAGFRWPFIVFGISMAVATILIWYVVPQPDVRQDQEPLSIRRAVANYGLLLNNRDIAMATAAYFLMFFGIGLYVVYLPTWLDDRLHVSAVQIASLFFAGGLAGIVAGPMAGKLSDQLGRKPLIVWSCIGLGIVMVATTYLVDRMWVAYVLFSLAMMLVAMRVSPLQSLMSALVSSDRRGTLMSLAIAIGQVGVGAGSAVAGFSYSHLGYAGNTTIGAVSLFVMAYLVRRAVPEPQKVL